MAYEVKLTKSAVRELKAIRVFDQRRITDAMNQQLTNHPTVATRNRKRLDDVTTDFDFEPPLWELRCEAYRIFYDVDERNQTVQVRAIRRKGKGQTTEDITHETNDA
jgi:mRNA-degrading endonuclease RelE of RelBE toxin-antitoxin system